jgi:hypothetical protein
MGTVPLYLNKIAWPNTPQYANYYNRFAIHDIMPVAGFILPVAGYKACHERGMLYSNCHH